jgi:hypothetical protein
MVVLILTAWVLSSLALTLMWVGYRLFIGKHSLEDFEVPVERRLKSMVRP